MSETIVYEPKPEYVVQVGEFARVRLGSGEVVAAEVDWSDESYHFTIEDATDSANYLALSNPYVRVIKREVS